MSKKKRIEQLEKDITKLWAEVVGLHRRLRVLEPPPTDTIKINMPPRMASWEDKVKETLMKPSPFLGEKIPPN